MTWTRQLTQLPVSRVKKANRGIERLANLKWPRTRTGVRNRNRMVTQIVQSYVIEHRLFDVIKHDELCRASSWMRYSPQPDMVR